MVDLILRPSGLLPGKSWALQFRTHECCGPTEYHTISRVSDEVAREIIRAGAPFWLFVDPDEQPPANAPVKPG
ncbi:MAG: hypothetical protein M0Z28_14580 [Rhodospirillales bacterium]|nr:hypothetical protein [Rhodospirillales bacterium]